MANTENYPTKIQPLYLHRNRLQQSFYCLYPNSWQYGMAHEHPKYTVRRSHPPHRTFLYLQLKFQSIRNTMNILQFSSLTSYQTIGALQLLSGHSFHIVESAQAILYLKLNYTTGNTFYILLICRHIHLSLLCNISMDGWMDRYMLETARKKKQDACCVCILYTYYVYKNT